MRTNPLIPAVATLTVFILTSLTQLALAQGDARPRAREAGVVVGVFQLAS